MQYTSLGRSGLKVSRLCLGTMNFGPQTTEEDSFQIMDHALAQGINFWDTADVYGWKTGEGVTEQIIGRFFAQGGGRREKSRAGHQSLRRHGQGRHQGLAQHQSSVGQAHPRGLRRQPQAPPDRIH